MTLIAGRRAPAPLALIVAAVLGCVGPAPSPSPSATAGPTAPVATASRPPTSTPDPTPGPDQTVEGQLPLRTAVEISADIATRPGVPAGLRDRFWWTWSDAGRVGTTAQIGLPGDEHVLYAGDDLVVAERRSDDPQGSSMLVVRDFVSGAIIRELPIRLTSPAATIIGRTLVWAGTTGNVTCGQDADLRDGGVWRVGLDGDDEPVAIVEPGTPFETCFSGRELLRSPSGKTLGAVLSSYGPANWIDVIDASSLVSERRLDGVWPRVITEGAWLQWDTQPTDGLTTGSGMTAFDLVSGAVRWRFPAATNVDRFAPYRFAVVGSRFAVQYIWRTGSDSELIVATFDPRTGDRRVLFREPDGPEPGELELRPELSWGGTLALVPMDAGTIDVPVSVIDIETGVLTRDAFVIDPPWLCTPEYCLRD